MKPMNIRKSLLYLCLLAGSIFALPCFSQCFSGSYTAEWQWNTNKKTNWLNLLRLDLNLPIKSGTDYLEAATLHMAKAKEGIGTDWQAFSNIEADNNVAALAVLGYRHAWENANVFLGVRNVNEDFFTSDVTSFFVNSSCGIFPTIAASYPIANYPFSGLTVYFDVSRNGWTFRNSLYNGVGYNGWRRHDNPFLVRPKKDGVFNISQLEYSHRDGHYFAGVAVHSRQFAVDEEGELLTESPAAETSCAWWAYGEQPLWKTEEKSISVMAQYSENTCHSNACRRYGEVGCVYQDSRNACGLSGQYALFQQGREYSVEMTWRRQLTRSLGVQPCCQYVTNADGDFFVVCARLCYDF